jgi:hypothetical protein
MAGMIPHNAEAWAKAAIPEKVSEARRLAA